MNSFVIVKEGDIYTTEAQPHKKGYKTQQEAAKVAAWLNAEEFQYVAPLGKGSNKIGKQEQDREEANERIKRRWKLK